MNNNFTQYKLEDLLPHRPPMLLIQTIFNIDNQSSQAGLVIDEEVPFYDDAQKGVPAWIGIEYMGQTAALIAGYQQKQGHAQPHLGFLLGTRSYTANVDYFPRGAELRIHCQEAALVGEELATFDCKITHNNSLLAQANLSVLRKAIDHDH